MPRGAVRCSNAHVLLCTLRFCAAILASIRLTKSILWKLAMENLSELEKILGYEFKNKHLLQQAVTHSSHTARLSENYERLEFLGDRVLGVSIASLLYRMFPNEPEGSLSQRHTGLVCKETVAEVALTLHLDKFMVVANEEIRENENVLCDVCEAVIGAIFMDAGCEQAVTFVNQHWKELIDKNVAPPKDSKTLLQEVAHSKGLGNPAYEVVGRAGSEHEPTFFMTVSLRGVKSQQGEGRNKKLAEQAAAAKMLDFLGYPHGTKC